MISERTKAGLAAAKARGKRLGGLNDAGITRRQEAIARAEALRPLLAEMEAAGMSARAMATVPTWRKRNTRSSRLCSTRRIALTFDRLTLQ
jgi:DNA invertase Pin-like site-specific DNA recombinase